jgi:CBS domain-containing protein
VTVGEICRRDVIVARPETPLPEAAALMKSYHVGDLVVVESKRGGQHIPIGILTDRDVALAVASHAMRIQYLHVSDVMKQKLMTAVDGESLHKALERMQAAGVRRLPVVNGEGVLEGIVTLDDILQVLSEELTDLAKLVLREQKVERLQRPNVI